jgi:hypothetical protein
MTQAHSVPSSSRQLITGESANQSTNLRAANLLRAVNLPAVRVTRADRRYFTGGSDARVIIGSHKAHRLRLGREKRGDEPKGRLKCRWCGANADQAPVGSNIDALCYANVAFFVGPLLRRIVQILLLFVGGNKHLTNSAIDKVSSNQLVPSRPQGRLR